MENKGSFWPYGGLEPIFYDSQAPDKMTFPDFKYYGFEPGTTILPKGHKRFPNKAAFPFDCVYDRDSAVTLRDGKRIYTDVFRLPGNVKVPAIIHWSPYGKTGTGSFHLWNQCAYNAGVDLTTLSGYDKFEAFCPIEWCPRGYAIVNPDARGAMNSEGDVCFLGPQEAEDIHDLIDWVSQQPWCNGSVVMAGNSWLSVAQQNVASRCPHPALKAIAPWEGYTDVYRDLAVRGGLPFNGGFLDFMVHAMSSRQRVEDMAKMAESRPFFDEYWASKRNPVEHIDLPMYMVASFTNPFHVRGSFECFMKAKSKNKWLRVHNTLEWHDLHGRAHDDDLQLFFDRYAKGIDNRWEETTPKVRLSLISFTPDRVGDIVERPEAEWPLARTQHKKLYLDASSHKLLSRPVNDACETSYDGNSLTSTAEFTFIFEEKTELVGYPKVKLWMSCDSYENMDVVVQLGKIGKTGQQLHHATYPMPCSHEDTPKSVISNHTGTEGALRLSHLCTHNKDKSNLEETYYDHDRSEPIPAGKIVPVEIGLWPMGVVYEAGEGIILRVAGHVLSHPVMAGMGPTSPQLDNKGNHVLHTGGKYDAYLSVPCV